MGFYYGHQFLAILVMFQNVTYDSFIMDTFLFWRYQSHHFLLYGKKFMAINMFCKMGGCLQILRMFWEDCLQSILRIIDTYGNPKGLNMWGTKKYKTFRGQVFASCATKICGGIFVLVIFNHLYISFMY